MPTVQNREYYERAMRLVKEHAQKMGLNPFWGIKVADGPYKHPPAETILFSYHFPYPKTDLPLAILAGNKLTFLFTSENSVDVSKPIPGGYAIH